MKKHYWLIAAIICAAGSLWAEETATVNRARVNMRGGASFASEVIGQLQKGDQVTVLDEVAVEKPKPGEPAKWAAIKLPQSTPVWVFTDFLNEKTVKVPKLNLRAGPGENYSVVGRLQKGDSVKEIRTVEGWMQIETPENARAYVDASYLTRTNAAAPTSPTTSIAEEKPKVFEPKKEAPPVITKPEPTVAATTPAPKVETPNAAEAPKPVKSEPEPKPETKLEPAVVKEEPKVVAAAPAKPEENKAPPVAKDTPKVEAPKVEEPKTATKAEPAPVATTEKPPEIARPLPAIGAPIASRTTNTVTVKRVVRREGVVHSTKFSIQAPTYFELASSENGKVINYLTAEKAGLKLKDYKGLRVIVTGEEMLESRFPDKPMLEVETIEVAP